MCVCGVTERGIFMRCIQRILLALIVVLIVTCASAGLADEGDYQYQIGDNGKATITGFKGNELIVYVPSSIDGYEVEAIGEFAFQGAEITEVVLPETILSIGEYGFGNIKALTKVTTYATLIGKSAFSGCSGLSEIKLLSGTAKAEESAFYSCKSLKTIVGTISDPGEYAFAYCSSLPKIEITGDRISSNAFYNCSELKNVLISDGSISANESAFASCSKLETITGTISDPGEYAFSYCSSLSEIKLTGAYISSNAFYNCSELQSVTIVDGPITVRDTAFQSCAKLETVSGVISDPGEYAFEYCDQLKEINISGKKVSSSAFYYCKNLETVSLLTPKMHIESYAFYSCEKLTTVNGVVGNIDDDAFSYCTSLTSLRFAGTEIDDSAFYGCDSFILETPQDDAVESIVVQAEIKYIVRDFDVPEEELKYSNKSEAGEYKIEAGVYNIGADLEPGSYELSLSGISNSANIAILKDDVDYESFNRFVANRTVRNPHIVIPYSKLLFITKEDYTFHLTVHEGERLYIGEGYGIMSPTKNEIIIAGIYFVGEDIEPGKYVMEFSDVENACYIASFESYDKYMSFISKDTAQSLAENSKFAIRASEGEPISVSLEQGDILLILNGKGMLSKAESNE